MQSTSPSAKRQPYSVQYTPSDSNMDESVPSLVRPSSNGFQPVSSSSQIDFSLNSTTARPDEIAARKRRHPVRCGAASTDAGAPFESAALGGAPASSCSRRPRMTPVMRVYCLDSGGKNGS